jgi:hypothetical protein
VIVRKMSKNKTEEPQKPEYENKLWLANKATLGY